jgi:hypothetical protein
VVLRRQTNPFQSQISQPQQAPRRFRVALSFPGKHRGRVEKIAETLKETGYYRRDAQLKIEKGAKAS